MRGFIPFHLLVPIAVILLTILVLARVKGVDLAKSLQFPTTVSRDLNGSISELDEEIENTKEQSPSPAATPSETTSPSPVTENQIESKVEAKEAPSPSPSPAPAPKPAIATSNSLPANGYSRQVVTTDIGNFTVSIVAADLNSTRVIVDTAAGSNCANDCPVMSLGDYVARNGAYAGINGPYFCPATYESCSGKKNSFDTLLMNKNKVYFNSDNNVYSTIPAAIFYGSSSRFVGQSLEWGRDTGVDSVIANYPLLLRDGNINFTNSGDGKLTGIGSRSFIGTKDNYAYIGVVSSATVAEVAVVLKAMGMKNALNLDSGGSTAFWFGGYKFGPGRGLPFGILLVRK